MAPTPFARISAGDGAGEARIMLVAGTGVGKDVLARRHAAGDLEVEDAVRLLQPVAGDELRPRHGQVRHAGKIDARLAQASGQPVQVLGRL